MEVSLREFKSRFYKHKTKGQVYLYLLKNSSKLTSNKYLLIFAINFQCNAFNIHPFSYQHQYGRDKCNHQW